MRALWFWLHIVGVVGFVAIHGEQAFAMFRIRSSGRDREAIEALTERSKARTGLSYLALGVIVVSGTAAGIHLSEFGTTWIWAAIIVLLITVGLMSVTATPWMKRLRYGCTRWADGSYTMDDAELAATLDGPIPFLVAGIGTVGLIVILLLMFLKPGA
jgi:cytochrome bd-type quinol oxidase subunit 2